MKTLEIMFKIKSAMFKPMLDICRQVSTALVGVLVRIRSSAATLCFGFLQVMETFLKLRGLLIGTNPVTSLAISIALMVVGTVLIFLPLRSDRCH